MPPEPHPPPAAGFPPGLVEDVLADALAHGGRVYGIAGLQGSGKSTLAAQVAALGASRGKRIAVLSIDDVYLDRPQRLALARTVHPLFATRGPPGTHDLPLALETLDALRDGRATALPRFDKLGDHRLPEAAWPRVDGTDLAIFEGWCLATPPEAPDALAEPLNMIERDEDPDGTWRRHCNDALSLVYPPLWRRIDRLLWLAGPGFDIVPAWRWQQERTLQAANPGRTTMTRIEVERFVQLFERTSRQAQRTVPSIADRVVRLDAGRRPA